MKPFLLLLPFVSLHALFSADWPNWLGPHAGRRLHRVRLGNDLDNLQWKYKVGVGFSSMVVADGRLFTMGHDGDRNAEVRKPFTA